MKFVKIHLFSMLYGFLLFVLTFMIFRPDLAAELLHISTDAVSRGYLWVAILAAVVYMLFMNRVSRGRPRDWKAGLIVAIQAMLWFPYWLLFVLIAWLIL
ncbi:hypothetical protein [Sporolactobacillus sp. THM19-2]|jgi:hypothetical protein|uniref:hypothetical protein n=1 Tax=Sporolactobacillus sp. THM19-2 TaxID=2511171 RepID=UPI00101E87A5|nr:hypothetical protein [Sporolactobacillus sp. THM19-2]RYL92420.1 hypothetical protein EWH91_07760 [Sporolactobacillus sp. THM19-2]